MKKGFTLLEILVGVSIITSSFMGILTVFDRLTKASRQMVELNQANFLLEEGLEVARIWRDNSWTNLSNWPDGTEYYLTWMGSGWATSTVNTFLDNKFERKVEVSAVSRDGSDDIIPPGGGGGTDDPGTKLVTMSVAWWNGVATTTKSASTYLTDFFN